LPRDHHLPVHRARSDTCRGRRHYPSISTK
jgi:hypothetical protein